MTDLHRQLALAVQALDIFEDTIGDVPTRDGLFSIIRQAELCRDALTGIQRDARERGDLEALDVVFLRSAALTLRRAAVAEGRTPDARVLDALAVLSRTLARVAARVEAYVITSDDTKVMEKVT